MFCNMIHMEKDDHLTQAGIYTGPDHQNQGKLGGVPRNWCISGADDRRSQASAGLFPAHLKIYCIWCSNTGTDNGGHIQHIFRAATGKQPRTGFRRLR